MSKNRGFTLIELMIVVAIIGILAAIAIPNFVRYQLRSRSAELPTNITSIKTAAISTNGAAGTFFSAAQSPIACAGGVLPGSDQKCDWRAVGPFDSDANDLDQLNFSGLGWIPEGPTYGVYAVLAGCANGPRFGCFSAEAIADIDADGVSQQVGYYKPSINLAANAGPTALNVGTAIPCQEPDQTNGAWENVIKCGDNGVGLY